MGNAYLNGKWMPLEEITVSPLDRGFLFGDGVYEVIPVYGGVPFFLGRHLKRLERSLAAIRIPQPMDAEGWRKTIGEQVSRQDFDTQAVYLQVTRGVAPRKHCFPAPDTSPTVFMMSSPLEPFEKELEGRRVKLTTGQDRRWLNCDVKSVSLLGAVLAAQQAKEAECDEIILFRDGMTTECSASNVLVVKDGVIVSPVRDHRILPGITLGVTLDLARKLGVPVEERDIPEAELRAADEIWVTSSTKEITTCRELDGKPFGPDRPSELFALMSGEFGKFVGIPDLEL